jgi:putative DNA primase/helicase
MKEVNKQTIFDLCCHLREIISARTDIRQDFIQNCLADEQTGDARLFAKAVAKFVLFDIDARRWYAFYRHHWHEVSDKVIPHVISDVLQVVYSRLNQNADRHVQTDLAKRFGQLNRNPYLKNIAELATGCPEIGISHSWNATPFLLPCQNGVVDLTTGILRSGLAGDYINRWAPLNYTGIETPAPAFEKFLDEIFAGNREMIDFIQRLFGYGLSGTAREHILPIFHGEGRNGKDTLIETIGAVLGMDLSYPLPSDFLASHMNSSSDAPSPAVSNLRGKLLVWSNEFENTKWLNEAKVKYLTGGNTIQSRPLYQDYTSFEPTFLLIMVVNKIPQWTKENALKHRFKFVEFPISFVEKPEEPHERPRDLRLREKLLAEKEGILAWLVRGCLLWQQSGLREGQASPVPEPPPIEETDHLARYIKECCVVEKGAEIQSSSLHWAYKIWLNLHGLPEETETAFGKHMETLGYKKVKKSVMFYQDLRLKSG